MEAREKLRAQEQADIQKAIAASLQPATQKKLFGETQVPPTVLPPKYAHAPWITSAAMKKEEERITEQLKKDTCDTSFEAAVQDCKFVPNLIL